MNRLLACVATAALLTACASTAATPRPVRGAAGAITRAELDAAAAPDALELIRTLRPLWLPRDAAAVDVYLGASRLGGVPELGAYRPAELDRVEYVGAGEAPFRFPNGTGRPVIVLFPRR